LVVSAAPSRARTLASTAVAGVSAPQTTAGAPPLPAGVLASTAPGGQATTSVPGRCAIRRS
jgi:hypothetical protein